MSDSQEFNPTIPTQRGEKAPPIPTLDPFVDADGGGSDYQKIADFAETSKAEVVSSGLENDYKSKTFLGMYDLRFDAGRYEEILKQKGELEAAKEEYSQKISKERDGLEKQILGDKESQASAPARRLRMAGIMRRQVRSGTNDAENLARFREIGWGDDDHMNGIKSRIRQLGIEERQEIDKRSDAGDLADVVTELSNESRLPEPKFELESDRTVLSKTQSEKFLEKPVPDSEYHEKKKKKIAKNVGEEVWFHTTKHLVKMVENGGFGTQSWIRKNNSDYHDLLVKNSTARGVTTDPELSSPMNLTDTDRIFFGADFLRRYGNQIIAFAPEDIVLDTGLYFTPDGGHFDNGERIVSDVVDVSKDRIPSDGQSNLLIAFDKAFVAVQKKDFRETCKQFLLAGYSQDWILAHVFSYRGYGEDVNVGQKMAVTEIKRRIEEQRKSIGNNNVYAVANPFGDGFKTEVYQCWSGEKREVGEMKMAEESLNNGIRINREELDVVLNNAAHTSADVLAVLDKDFGEELDSSAGVFEGYSLRQHVLMVMNQYRKYFGSEPLPGNVDHRFFEVILALHDIGKPKAISEGNKDNQHKHTVDIISDYLPILGYSESEIKLAIALIDGDPIGSALKGRNVELCVEEVREMAEKSGMETAGFWKLLKIFYQVDAGSYTEDSGGKRSLDRWFVFEPENGKMRFSDAAMTKVGAMDSALGVM